MIGLRSFYVFPMYKIFSLWLSDWRSHYLKESSARFTIVSRSIRLVYDGDTDRFVIAIRLYDYKIDLRSL